MNEWMKQSVASRFPLRELDIGRYASISGKEMRFITRVYDAEGAGRLCLMEMRAFAGFMRMESAVFSPTGLDGPLFSCDTVEALGSSTLLLELYDTTLSHPVMEKLNEIKEKYAALPPYDPGKHWYDALRLPVSDCKKGFRRRAAFAAYAKDYGEAYFALLPGCGACDPAEKMRKNAEYAEGLLKNGGPAVDTFRKILGREKTAEFLKRYMFCCAE